MGSPQFASRILWPLLRGLEKMRLPQILQAKPGLSGVACSISPQLMHLYGIGAPVILLSIRRRAATPLEPVHSGDVVLASD